MTKIKKDSRILLLGMCLGDGHLDKYGQLNILHSTKQEDYVIWKHKLLRSYGLSTNEVKKVNNNGFPAVKFSTNVTKYSKLLRAILYRPKKTYPLKQLNKLTPLELAIWFMDDGGLSNAKCPYTGGIRATNLILHTNISKEENEVIISYFEDKWKVKFKLAKKGNYYTLRANTVEARKFIRIVEPYVRRVPSMAHKLNVKPLTKNSLSNGRAKRSETGASLLIDNDMI